MKCQTCCCELTQAEANRAPDILPGAGPLCFECAEWLDIETRDEDSLTLATAGHDLAPSRLDFPRNPK
jgi:hypothetical protein